MDDLALAHHLADRAAAIALPVFGPTIVHETKADGSPVTATDLEVSRMILDVFAAERPNDGVLSEEHGERLGTSGRRWIVDPIDGTVEFMAGDLGWATYVALEVEGVLELGVIGIPADGVRYWARNGNGTLAASTVDGLVVGPERPVRVSSSADLGAAVFTAVPPTPGPALETLVAASLWVACTRSFFVDLLEGRIDYFLSQGGEVWDHAAEVILLEEAGGRFRDPAGGRRLDMRGGVYSNGHLDEAIGSALGRW